jgi:hypothetical protein
MECLLARCGGLGHAGTFSARKIVASPTSYSRASSAIVSPAAYLSAILRFWPASSGARPSELLALLAGLLGACFGTRLDQEMPRGVPGASGAWLFDDRTNGRRG